jgi:uncharacterized protein YjbI with pentapeptide repeats
MPNRKHVQTVRKGAEAVAKWRSSRREQLDLTDADLVFAFCPGTDLSGAAMSEANLTDAQMAGVNFSHASLRNADFTGADLENSVFSGARLQLARFRRADLAGADFNGAALDSTSFIDVDLSKARNLDACIHTGPSEISVSTVLRSGGAIPDNFLRGCGVNPLVQKMLTGPAAARAEAFYSSINARPATTTDFADTVPAERTMRLQTCYISHAHEDREFAERLQKALNARGIDYWYLPEHGRLGTGLPAQIDRHIRTRDRIILVCSESFLKSDWAQNEVERSVKEADRRLAGMAENTARDAMVMEGRPSPAATGQVATHAPGRNAGFLFPVTVDDFIFSWNGDHSKSVREMLSADFRNGASTESLERTADALYRTMYGSD